MPKLNEEQALAGLLHVWKSICDNPKHLDALRPEDNVVDRFTSDVNDSLGEVSFFCGLVAEFGGSVTDQEIQHWFTGGLADPYGRDVEQWERDVKPTLTVRQLSQWLAERTQMPSFAPINVAGRNCGPAGAFFGIAETVEALTPGDRFPPRALILNRIRGHKLDRAWSRLNVYASGKLPDLNFPHTKAGEAIVLAAVLLFVIGLFGSCYFNVLPAIPVLIPICIGLGRYGNRLSYTGDPLPPHIKIFRDLAYVMSDSMNGPEPARVARVWQR